MKKQKDKNIFKKLLIEKEYKIYEIILMVIIPLLIGFLFGLILKGRDKKFDNNKYINKFLNNYNYVLNNYYKKVDEEKLIDSAIAGMMNSLEDPYSVYMDEETTNSMNITLDGSYKGIGLVITKLSEEDFIKVVGVFKESPADKADIRVNDIIKKINNKSTKEMTTTDFSSMVIENSDKKYKLVIERDGEEITKDVDKENIVIDSVTHKLIEKENKKIGYIYISVFALNTPKQFNEAIKDLEKQGINYLIIDVRNNTGGHLSSVDTILKGLCTKKQVIYQMNKGKNTIKEYGVASKNKDYEIILLGNGYSASAAEMLIGALKDNFGSKLIGEKTYGKGTVQEMVNMNNKEKYKITTQKWLTPKGTWINKTKGIIPDIEVKLDDNYNEDDESTDNQLNKAIEYIINK